MGRHQPWSVWFAYLYLMGLKVSNRQMAEELNLNESDGQAMAEAWRGGMVQRRPPVRMGGVVECDEVYVVAGPKGRPDRIQGRAPRRRRLQGAPGRGTLAKEKPPIFGMIERGGAVRIVIAGERTTANDTTAHRGHDRTRHGGQYGRVWDLCGLAAVGVCASERVSQPWRIRP